ncbi:transmembrane and death domain protein 1 [Lonchura striata]
MRAPLGIAPLLLLLLLAADPVAGAGAGDSVAGAGAGDSVAGDPVAGAGAGDSVAGAGAGDSVAGDPVAAGDSVAAAVGRHSVARIAELLATPECRRLRAELSGPEPEERPDEPVATRREEELARRRRWEDGGARGCSEELRAWLATRGEATTWDRLVRALRRIGRSDIARELGKNLNQDRALELRRNVQGYRRSVQHLGSAQLRPGRAPPPAVLLFQRRSPPRYGRGLLGWLRPVLLGALGAFLGSALLAAAAGYFCHWRRLLGA